MTTHRSGIHAKKRIAFVSIFDLTRLFHKISEGMVAAGCDIFWITTDKFWTDWLCERSVDPNNILQLIYSPSDFLDDETKENILGDIIKSEANADLTANQSLMMDQFVKYKNKPDINEYVFLYYRDIKRFLGEKQVTHLFAEPTNTNEMITFMICRELGIKFISPRNMRYPENRLIFFDSYLQKDAWPRLDDDPTISGEALINSFKNRKTAPEYFKRHNKTPVVETGKVARSIKTRLGRNKIFSQNNLTHHDLGGRIKLTLRRTFNSSYMKHLCRYEKLDEIKGRIVFYGLHVQPESSIDVLGSFFSDQLKLIKDIRRSLPFDTTLVVKEHPNFLGIKKLDFFRQLRRIPNVRLIKHDVSTFDIYSRAAIIFTVSGTTAYEAGLLGIPAVTFAEMYFSGLSSIHLCTDLTKLRDLVWGLLNGFKRNYRADCDFMDRLGNSSYKAFWSDPNFDSYVLSQENVNRLQIAFLKVVSTDGA